MLAKLYQDLAVAEFVEKVKSNSSGFQAGIHQSGHLG